LALLLSEVYDALLDAGASEEKARKAAEAVAAYENRRATIERTLEVHTDMLGTLIMIGLSILWKVFR